MIRRRRARRSGMEGPSFLDGPLAISATDDLGDEIGYAFLNFNGTTTDTTMDFTIDHMTGAIGITAAPAYNSEDSAANQIVLVIQATDRSPGATGDRTADIEIAIEVLPIVDADGDGLIEIGTLEELSNMRYNLEGTSYKVAADSVGDTAGCPDSLCDGYELTQSLDFAEAASYAAGVVNSDWIPNATSADMATNAGWEPIGSCNEDTGDSDPNRCGDADDEPFAAIFEGNGNTITNLYIRGDGGVGLFGVTGGDAEIRRIGMIENNSYDNNTSSLIGGLVGINGGEVIAIIASYATGSISSGRTAGGLVGSNSGSIIASYAIGSVNAIGAVNRSVTVGGLVGSNSGDIIASYATGDITGDGSSSNVGGLVGSNDNGGSIIASYATGDITGDGRSTNVGGLVGSNSGKLCRRKCRRRHHLCRRTGRLQSI